MPIKKGRLNWAEWEILEPSLERVATFANVGAGAGIEGFEYFRKNVPEVAEALLEALKKKYAYSSSWARANVYRFKQGKEEQFFVIASQGKHRAMFYPDRVPLHIENALLLNANIVARRNLASFLWHLEGGRMFMFLYPPFGALVMWGAWLMAHIALLGSSAPDAWYYLFMVILVLGAGICMSPGAYSWWKRYKLRSGLYKIAHNSDIVAGMKPA